MNFLYLLFHDLGCGGKRAIIPAGIFLSAGVLVGIVFFYTIKVVVKFIF